MPLALKPREVGDRLRDYARENYLLLANVIKGVVLGTAAQIAVQIASDWANNGPKVTAFVCSGAATFLTYITWTRGVLLTTSRSNTRDAVFPLSMGGAEVCLFAVLSKDAPWHFWFLVLAMHMALAVLLVRNRMKNTRAEDFDPELRKMLYEDYMTWLRHDANGATVGTVLSLLFWGITLWCRSESAAWGSRCMVLLPLAPLVFIIYVTLRATRQSQIVDERISNFLLKQEEQKQSASC